MSDSKISKKLPLFILMLNLFIAQIGQGMVMPILPDYLKQFNAAGAVAGYLISVFGTAQFIVSPIGGKLSDKYGRRILILSGLFLTVVSDFIFAISNTLFLLYAARAIGGIGIGLMLPSVFAYVADITTNETRAKGMGYISAAMNFGVVLGPSLGGVISQFGIRVPYFFASGLGFVATLLTFILPETLTVEKRNLLRSEKQESIVNQIIESFRKPYFRYLLLVFVMTFGVISFQTVYSLFVESKYGYTSQDVSILLTVGALMGVIVQLLVIEKAIKFFGEHNLIRLSLLITAIALLLMIVKVNFVYLIVISAIFYAFNSFLRPTTTTLLSNAAGKDEQGFVSGLNTTYMSMGNIVGPVLAGGVFDKQINLPYVMSAIILFGAIFLVGKRKKVVLEANT